MPVRVISETPVGTETVVCRKCCYRLEYTDTDIQSYTSGSDDYHFIMCPRSECGEKVLVKPW